MSETINFSLPSVPDDFAVSIPTSDLRRIKYSALDYRTSLRAMIEYLKSYYPDDFNNFVASNGYIAAMEIIATQVDKLSLRGDLLYNNAFLSTSTSDVAVDNHLALIGQRIKRQTPASVNIELSVQTPYTFDIAIPAKTQITTIGPDKLPLIYELFSSPNDFVSDITIPSGKRGVVAYGLEGSFTNPITFIASGMVNEQFVLNDLTIIESPISVTVNTNGNVETWVVIYEPIERYGPNDKVVEVRFVGSRVTFTFGNDINGKALLGGQIVSISYRVGGGSRGRIGSNRLVGNLSVSQPSSSVSALVSYRNQDPSSGGTDRETIDNAKRRAPRQFLVRNSIVMASDYIETVVGFSHPVYGTVAKAVAALKSSKNANVVEFYILALGDENSLAAPSVGLKQAVETYCNNLNVITDNVVVLDGSILYVDLDMTVVVDKNYDSTVVQVDVNEALNNYFDIDNWQMGEPLFISDIIDTVNSVDGVKYVDLFLPSDNILSSEQVSSSDDNLVDMNEIIRPGNIKISYFYEKGKV